MQNVRFERQKSQVESLHTDLGWFSLHSFDFAPNEAIQHRLKQVDHESDLRLVLVSCQRVHLVVVTFHQVFVCNLGLLSVTKSMEANKQSERHCREQKLLLECVSASDTKAFFKQENNALTWSEYMPLMVSLNCMVAVRKTLSVGDRSFILVRSSFT